MISGFVDPWEPLFIDLNIPNYFKNKKIWKHVLVCLETENVRIVGTGLENTRPYKR